MFSNRAERAHSAEKLMNYLFVLNGPTANRGCEGILLSTYDVVRSVDHQAKFINSSMGDGRCDTEPYLQLERMRHAGHPPRFSRDWVSWQVTKRFTARRFYFERFLPWADFVVSLGGDNYTLDYGVPDWLVDANERILGAGKKLVIWGASIGPFTSEPTLEKFMAERLKLAHAIVVRESRTQAYLAGLGVRRNVIRMPDPAFSLQTTVAIVPPDIEAMLIEGSIGVNLSPLLGRYRSNPDSWSDEAASWVAGLLDATDRPLLLIPHVMQDGNDDEAFMSALLKKLNRDPGRFRLLAARQFSACQLKHVISRLQLFVGARTHATIAAMSSNVPTISIGYSEKTHGINEDVFGSNRWVLDHRQVNAEMLVDKVRELIGESAAVRSQLSQLNAHYRMSIDEVRTLLR
jgi:polysaccharide pyruvyl transferase WcaK-like protein